MVNILFATLCLSFTFFLIKKKPQKIASLYEKASAYAVMRLAGLHVQSGTHWNLKSLIKIYLKTVVFLLMICSWLAMTQQNLMLLVLAFCIFLMPVFFLHHKAKQRTSKILQEVPPLLDLTAITMHAGHDILSALSSVCKDARDSALQQEVKFVLQSTRLGVSRSEAFILLYERTQLPELHQLAISISQSEEYGHSLSNVLESQSWAIRQKLFLLSEQNAQKAPYKMLIPLLGLIFPVTFLLLLGPLMITFLQL